ncbi:MAG: glycosyltransferase family 2 protein [Chitinophagales bacterium]|nr:glycosyltransferase family 2 protein [Chitinophagales bacterium]
MENPFFSIIIPTYNRADLLLDTLKSIQAQTFADFECIIVDDGGRDHTEEVVKSLEDQRFRYYWKENAERGAARNYGAALANGKWLNFFDSDDLAYDFHLEKANQAAVTETYEIFHTSYDYYIDGKHAKPSIQIGRLNEKLMKQNILSCNNVFIPKQIFELHKFSENRTLSASEDWELWVRLAQKYTIIGLAEVTSSIVQHSTRSMALASGESTYKRYMAYLYEMNKSRIPDNIQKSVSAEMISLASLQYALEGKTGKAFEHLIDALKLNPSLLFSRRFLAIVKHSLRAIFI